MAAKKLTLLREFQDNAGCWYTQRKADRTWRKLRPYLTKEERYDLTDSWEHYRIGWNSRGLIDGTCEKIRKKWKEDAASE